MSFTQLKKAFEMVLEADHTFTQENSCFILRAENKVYMVPIRSCDPLEWASSVIMDLEPYLPEWVEMEERWGIQDISPVGEPGYDEDIIIIGEWYDRQNGSKDKRDYLAFQLDLLRIAHAHDTTPENVLLEFEDEWASCMGCYKRFRTEGDCASWKSSAIVTDCSYMCHECHAEDPEQLFEFLTNNPTQILTFDWDLTEHGWVCTNKSLDFSHTYHWGHHDGMNDDSSKILADLRSKGFPRVMFSLVRASQFYYEFAAWVRKEDVLSYRDGLPVTGIGLEPADERYLKVIYDDGSHVTMTADLFMDDCDQPHEVMHLAEGENGVFIECGKPVKVIRITHDCYLKHA